MRFAPITLNPQTTLDWATLEQEATVLRVERVRRHFYE
jgi:hypothetical protein